MEVIMLKIPFSEMEGVMFKIYFVYDEVEPIMTLQAMTVGVC